MSRFTFKMRSSTYPEDCEILLDGKPIDVTHVRIDADVIGHPMVELTLVAYLDEIDVETDEVVVKKQSDHLTDVEALERTLEILGNARRGELLDGMIKMVAARFHEAEANDSQRASRLTTQTPNPIVPLLPDPDPNTPTSGGT